MKNLLKLFICFVVLFSFSEAKAQISAGAGIVYGTNINSIGFSANGKYEINEQWSAAPSFTYFLKKNSVSWSALDLDANYQLTEVENIGGLYAIGGLNMTFWKIKYDTVLGDLGGLYGGSASASDAGINLGLGLNMAAGDNMAIAPEIKYTLGGANYLRIGVKMLFGL